MAAGGCGRTVDDMATLASIQAQGKHDRAAEGSSDLGSRASTENRAN
jgi:hypothetical protein